MRLKWGTYINVERNKLNFHKKMWDLYEELNNQEQQTMGDEFI